MKKILKNSKLTLGAGLLLAALVVGYFAHVALAGGIPASTPMTYAGLLEKADGTPLTSWHPIDFRLWDAATAGNKLCEVLSPTSGANSGYDLGTSGRFSITLPDINGNDCTAAVKAHQDLWVEVAVGGVPLPRTKLGAVPYAVEAGHAVRADAADSATNATNVTGIAPLKAWGAGTQQFYWQAGVATCSGGGGAACAVTFGKPFANGVLSILATQGDTQCGLSSVTVPPSQQTLTGFNAITGNPGCSTPGIGTPREVQWFAVGW